MEKPTVEQILALEPCIVYNRNKIQGILDSVNTWKDFLLLETLPYEDKIWIAVRLLPKDLVSKWIEIVVTRAITNHCKDSTIESVRTWAEKWLSGKDRSYSSAIHAVYAASYDTIAGPYAGPYAANDANDSATHAVAAAKYAADAAKYAADAAYATIAAYSAAIAASYSAANAAANVSGSAEKSQQLEDLINLIEGD